HQRASSPAPGARPHHRQDDADPPPGCPAARANYLGDSLGQGRLAGNSAALAFALSVFLVSTAILWLRHPNGAISTVAKVVAIGSLIVWALDEVVRGVNPWRRFLGVAVLIYEVFTVRL